MKRKLWLIGRPDPSGAPAPQVYAPMGETLVFDTEAEAETYIRDNELGDDVIAFEVEGEQIGTMPLN